MPTPCSTFTTSAIGRNKWTGSPWRWHLRSLTFQHATVRTSSCRARSRANDRPTSRRRVPTTSCPIRTASERRQTRRSGRSSEELRRLMTDAAVMCGGWRELKRIGCWRSMVAVGDGSAERDRSRAEHSRSSSLQLVCGGAFVRRARSKASSVRRIWGEAISRAPHTLTPRRPAARSTDRQGGTVRGLLSRGLLLLPVARWSGPDHPEGSESPPIIGQTPPSRQPCGHHGFR